MDSKHCCNKSENKIPHRSLSKEATEEILGDDLCFLIAIGKKTGPVRFLPHGHEENLDKIRHKLDRNDMVSILDISVMTLKDSYLLNESSEASLTNTELSYFCHCRGNGGIFDDFC